MLYSKTAQLTVFIIVLTQTWDPVAVTRCVCVWCLFGKVLHKQARFGLSEPVPWGIGKQALLQTHQSCILLFQFDLIHLPCTATTSRQTGRVHSCHVECFKRLQHLHSNHALTHAASTVQYYVPITLSACRVMILFWRDSARISTRTITVDAEKCNIRGFQIMTLRTWLQKRAGLH